MGKLQAQIVMDLQNAITEKNELKKSILRVVIGEFSRSKTKDIGDDEVLKILKFVAESASECGNIDEFNIVNQYLPKLLSEDELTQKIDSLIIEKNIDLSNKKAIGTIIGLLKSCGVAYDGAMATSIINKRLS